MEKCRAGILQYPRLHHRNLCVFSKDLGGRWPLSSDVLYKSSLEVPDPSSPASASSRIWMGEYDRLSNDTREDRLGTTGFRARIGV